MIGWAWLKEGEAVRLGGFGTVVEGLLVDVSSDDRTRRGEGEGEGEERIQ